MSTRRSQTKPFLMSENEPDVPVCPECRDGKHGNCVGSALHPITDDIVDCLCGECHKLK
jgi:hypothetical protein